jgi:hypothetical protein
MRFATPIRLLFSTALIVCVAVPVHAQKNKKQNAPAPRHYSSGNQRQSQSRPPANEQRGGGRPSNEPQPRASQPANQESNRSQIQTTQQQPHQYQGPSQGQAVTGNTSRLAPIERRENGGSGGYVNSNSGAPRGEHLDQWMNDHRNLNPVQQQQALENEPGFHDLPQATQQRMHDRLAQLNAMPEAQRNRILQRNEELEKLSPEQRTQVGIATHNFAALPADQRNAVGRSFRALRQLPPDQRAAALNSGRYTYGFTPQQRAALNGLMNVEPIYPRD